MAKQTYTTGQVLTAAQMTALQANDYNWTVSAKTASYVLVAADAGTRITMNNAGATTITVNTALFTAGDTLTITNIGAGACTITAGTATVSTAGSLVLNQYDSGTLYFSSTSASIWNGANPGDITGVTAGTGISGGGTSGTVTVTNSMATEITAAGDIIVGTGSGTFDNLPIGTTAQVLTADTTVSPYKVKWATPASGGGMTLISTTTLSGASITLSSIPQDYVNLQIFVKNFTNNTADGYIRFAPNTTTNNNTYASSFATGTYSTYGPDYLRTSLQGTRTNDSSSICLTYYNYAQDDFIPFILTGTIFNSNDYRSVFVAGCNYVNTAGSQAISSITISNSGGNWAGGTVYLYGVK